MAEREHQRLPESEIEGEIGRWRRFVERRSIRSVDVDELEDHLRATIASLVESGLTNDEAFLVAVKRMGELDALSREFAREYSDRLWKQLVVAGSDRSPGDASPTVATEARVVIALAITAAIAIKLPVLFGISISDAPDFYARNVPFFVLPLLALYLAWKRRLGWAGISRLIPVFAIGAILANTLPFRPQGATEALFILHLPIALWFVVGVAYAGGDWRNLRHRMDFVRFSGELFIYYVLIALGGGVLTAFTIGMFGAIGLDPEWLAEWLLPCGAMGAVLVGSWLVEAKQSVVENMAPVLTRLFTPLFTLVLVAFLGTMAWTGRGIAIERDVLIGFDLLLVLVLGLLLYAISARDPEAPPDLFDKLQVLLVVCALLVDGMALAAIGARISEFGFTPNRVAALGENVILLANLGWSAVVYLRFLRGRAAFATLETWQTSYLPVYAIWAAIVAVAFPPLFGYI